MNPSLTYLLTDLLEEITTIYRQETAKPTPDFARVAEVANLNSTEALKLLSSEDDD